jgi:hypothetical protein
MRFRKAWQGSRGQARRLVKMNEFLSSASRDFAKPAHVIAADELADDAIRVTRLSSAARVHEDSASVAGLPSGCGVNKGGQKAPSANPKIHQTR